MRNLLIIIAATAFLFTGCSETIDNTGTCSDGILNQGEQQIDCGGPCPSRCESCADGIMNQGETAVDCGGPCDPCYPRVSARIDTVSWWSTSRNAMLVSPSHLRINGSDGLKSITLDYTGPFKKGTTVTGTSFTATVIDESGYTFESVSGGGITFTTFDTLNNTASGTFNFRAFNAVSGQEYEVESGVFTEMSW